MCHLQSIGSEWLWGVIMERLSASGKEGFYCSVRSIVGVGGGTWKYL